MKPNRCQIHCLQYVTEGDIPIRPESLRKRAKLAFKRRLGHRSKRQIKRLSNRVSLWFNGDRGRNKDALPTTQAKAPTASFKAGDMVRVRSPEEIAATLNMWGELKGCGFLAEMWRYCDTTQRVLKPVERFLDERDYQMKKTKGLILLEGIMCEGTADYGRCDRACYFFWREEWLEKIC